MQVSIISTSGARRYAALLHAIPLVAAKVGQGKRHVVLVVYGLDEALKHSEERLRNLCYEDFRQEVKDVDGLQMIAVSHARLQ